MDDELHYKTLLAIIYLYQDDINVTDIMKNDCEDIFPRHRACPSMLHLSRDGP